MKEKHIRKNKLFCEACNVSSDTKYVHYHKDDVQLLKN